MLPEPRQNFSSWHSGSLRLYLFEVIYLLYLERFPFLFFLVPLPF